MTIALAFALTMVWVPVLAVVVQTASLRLTPGTREAAGAALRRCTALALFGTVCLAAVGAVAAAPWPLWVSGMAGFHVVWWIGARPLHRRDAEAVAAEVAAATEDSAPATQPSSRRVASLVSRDEAVPVPGALWAVPAAVLVLSAAALWWGLAERDADDARALVATSLWLGGASFLAAWGFWARAQRRSPQDLSRASDPAHVDALCREFRRFVVRGLFAGTVFATTVFAGAAAAAAWLGDDATALLGWAGGLGGALVGVWGAVFGALADRRRRAILEAGGVPPEPVLRSAAGRAGSTAS